MDNITPFFSIVIPTKNRPVFLRESIQSILYQDFDDYEIIVSDNFNETETKILHATILSIENLNSFLRVLDEAMSSSKSDDRKEEIIKGIKETAEDIETRFKVIIGFIKKEIDYLKQGKLRESEPTIVYFKSEHKQLIEK